MDMDLSSQKVKKKPLELTTPLSALNIPHLSVVLEEVFSIPSSFLTGVDPVITIKTIKDLIDQSILPERTIWKRLEGVISMSEEIELSCEQLAEQLKQEHSRPIVLDVREKWEFELCHLEDSLLGSEIDLQGFIEEVRCSKKQVVAVCHHGIRSFSAAMYLKQQGVANVKSLSGGLDRWAKVIDPQMNRY